MPAPIDFRALFDRSPNPYMLLDAGLVFAEANEAYLRVMGRTRESLIGRHVFDAFPDDPDEPGQSARLRASLERVLATGETDTLALIRYTIPRETPGGTVVDERFWTATNTPIFDDGGAVAFLLQHAIDVTELHRLRTATRASNGGASGGAASDGEGTPASPSSDGVVFDWARVAQQETAVLGDEVRRLRSVFDQAPAFVCSLEGPDHVFRYVNDACRDLLGGRDLLGLPVRTAVPEADGQGFFDLLDGVYATGEPFRGDTVPLLLQRTPGGGLEQRYVDFVYGPLRDGDGAIRGVLVHGVDVTERILGRRAVDELRGVNDLLLAHSPDVLCVLDADGRFVHMGAAATAVFGYTPAEMEGRHFSDFLHPDERAAHAGRGFAENTPLYTSTNRYRHRDGAAVYMEWSASWPEGSPGMLGVGRDVTARRVQEEALRERTAMLQTLLANLPGTVVYQAVRGADGQTRFTYLSDGVERLHGVTAAAAIADPGVVYGQVLPSHVAALAAAEDEALRTGRAFLTEAPFRHPDGTVRWIRLASAPRSADDGTTVWEGAEVDVTDRRVAEDAVRESDARARDALEIASVGVYDWDLGAHSAVLDARARAILGIDPVTPDGEIPRVIDASVHAGDVDRVRRAFAAGGTGDGAWHIEHRVVHPDGSVRHVVSRGQFAFAGEGAARRAVRLVGALLDVTAERVAEAALRESEARFRHLADSIPQLAWIAGADGSIGWYNDRWYAYTGTTLAEMQGWGWETVHHPGHVEAVKEKFRTHIASGEPWEDTFPLRGRDGVYRWFLSRAHPIRDAAGQVLHWFGTNTDVTEQREAAAALRDLNEALEARVAERTAALADANVQLEARNRELQDFAHVASHDLQEPLRKIQSFAGLLATGESGTLSADGRHYVARTQAAAERMSGLIRDLLAFSRVATQQQPAGPVDLDATLAAVLGDLELRIAQTGGVVESGALGTVVADPVQMRQLFQNLVGNALKYHRDGVPPVVRVTAERIGRERRGAAVRLVVSDNGIGFAPKHAERIFAPFQRLHGKGVYEGTGIGLAIDRRAPRRHRECREHAGRGQPLRRHAAGAVGAALKSEGPMPARAAAAPGL